MGRFLLLLFGVIGLLIAGQQYLSNKPQKKEYSTAKVKRSDVTETVAVTGYAEPLEVWNIEAEVPGQVQEVLVDFNDEVKVGQPLARLSSELQRVQLAQAQAQLKAAKAAIKTADAASDASLAGLKMAQALRDAANRELATLENLTAGALLEQSRADAQREKARSAEAGVAKAESDIKAAQAAQAQAVQGVEVAQVAVNLAELNLDKTELRANMNGMILNKTIRVGDRVGVPKVSLTQSSTALFEIAHLLNKMQAIVSVSEADYSQVEPDQKATFTIDTYPDEVFEARVKQIRNAPTADRNAVSYATVLEFDNKRDPKTGMWMVRPRSTVSADIVVRKVENALVVPNAALLYTPAQFDIVLPATQKGQSILWVLAAENRPEPRVVRPGVSDGTNTEIIDGDVKEGEAVITAEPTVAHDPGFRLPLGN